MKTQEKRLHDKTLKRKIRVRKHLNGTAIKPRLCVVKSNLHIEAQLIDDKNGITLASISTRSKELKGTEWGKKNCHSAKKIGEVIALKAAEKQIETCLYDRGAHKYHGILAVVADAAREAGLKF